MNKFETGESSLIDHTIRDKEVIERREESLD
jgi:hypothetical protein